MIDHETETPGELVQHLEYCAKMGFYYEIPSEEAEVLLHYIRGLERDSRALTELRAVVTYEDKKREMLLKLAQMGAFKLQMKYLASVTDWRGLYGSAE